MTARTPCLIAFALLLAFGCGRTNFASFNPTPSAGSDRGVPPGVDAGPPRDRGPDRPDLGDPPEPGCAVGPAVDVFVEGSAEAFDETFIGVRDNGVDLAANIEGNPGGELVARTAQPSGLDVNLIGNRVSLGATADGNAVFTSGRGQAMSVRRIGQTANLTVWDVVNDSYLERRLRSRMEVSNVLAAAPVTEGWFYAWFDGGRVRYQVLDEALLERNPPAELCGVGACLGQSATATAGSDGRVRVIADDTPPSTALRLQTVGAVGDLDVTTLTLPSAVQGQPGVAVEAAPGGFTLAWFDDANLAVTYFPPVGAPRSEDVASTAFAQDSPGLAGLAEGVVVAQLTFGSDDPTTGTLQVFFVPFDADRSLVTATAIEIRRDVSLASSGVAVAALDDTRALVHFTNVSGAVGTAATQALVVRCN